MGGRGTLVLVILVLIAGGVFLLSPTPPEELPSGTLLGEPRYLRDTPSPRLLDFAPADVAKITLGYRDEVITVARQGDSWRGAADPRNLNDFLESLERATVISSIEEENPPGDFGLDTPARRILLETQQGGSLVLLIGDRNPPGTSVYVRANDGPVSIAGALVMWEFDKAFAAMTGRKSPL